MEPAKGSPDVECCVCFQPGSDLTPCGHPVCRRCMSQLKRSICPVCRYDFQRDAPQSSIPSLARSSSAPGVSRGEQQRNSATPSEDFLHSFRVSANRDRKERATQECLRILNQEQLPYLNAKLQADTPHKDSEHLADTHCGWFRRSGRRGTIEGATVLHIAALNGLAEVCQAILARPDFTEASAVAIFRFEDGRVDRRLSASAIANELCQSCFHSPEAVQLVNSFERHRADQPRNRSSTPTQLRRSQNSNIANRPSRDNMNRSHGRMMATDILVRSDTPFPQQQSGSLRQTSRRERRSPTPGQLVRPRNQSDSSRTRGNSNATLPPSRGV